MIASAYLSDSSRIYFLFAQQHYGLLGKKHNIIGVTLDFFGTIRVRPAQIHDATSTIPDRVRVGHVVDVV